MDGSRFDAWTRRHFGLAAGGLAASLMGLAASGDVEAKKKKKKKKKKCKNLGVACTPGGKRKCCGKKGLSCQPPIELPGGFHCCRRGFEPCASASECCSETCTDGFCACKTEGLPCLGIDAACCSLNCGGEGPACQPA
jgi:hypothetical protein